MSDPQTTRVTARTNLPPPSAAAAFDSCFHTRSADQTNWTLAAALEETVQQWVATIDEARR